MLSADPAVDRHEYMRGNLVYNEVDPLPLMGAILALYTHVSCQIAWVLMLPQ